MNNKFVLHRIVIALLVLFGIFLHETQAGNIIDLQQGIHPDFDLLVVYFDSPTEVEIRFDRIKQTLRLQLEIPDHSSNTNLIETDVRVGKIIDDVILSDDGRSLSISIKDDAFIRTYMVSGPPALLIDLSHAQNSQMRLPYEMTQKEYQHASIIAERSGDFNLTLEYLQLLKRINPDDLLTFHRSGIVEHKLGRWDVALKSFEKTVDSDEFAADAHAHRTLIYLSRGDTISATDEWMSYFHEDSSDMFQFAEKSPQEEQTVATLAIGSTKDTDQSKHNRRKSNDLSSIHNRIIQAGQGNYVIFGWLSLILGGVVLIKVLFSGKQDDDNFEYRDSEEVLTDKQQSKFKYRHSETSDRNSLRSKRNAQAPLIADHLPVHYIDNDVHTTTDSVKIISEPIKGAQTKRENRSFIRKKKLRKVPVDKILERKKAGKSELEIAASLGVGRDEVAMVINLAALGNNISSE